MRHQILRPLTVAGALTIAFVAIGSPVAGAQPADADCAPVTTTTSPPTTTTPADACPPESPSATTTVPTEPSESTASTSPDPTPPDSTPPTTSVLTTVPTIAADETAPEPALAADGPPIVSAATSLVGPNTIAPGQTWTATMNLAVTNAGEDGWTSSVSLSTPRGTNTGHLLTPDAATYSAPASACNPGPDVAPAVTVQLTEQAQVAKTGGPLCVTDWIATVSIQIPATGVVADTYQSTLTHSIY